MNPPKKPTARPFLKSFAHASRGLTHLLKTERNARIHALATLTTIVASFALHLTPAEWCPILLAIASVWTAEALNTALELLCNVTHPTHHPLIGRAKDTAAAAVLIAATTSLTIALLTLLPHLKILTPSHT